MNKRGVKIFLTSFFSLFKAYMKEYLIEDNKVLGVVGWQNEEDEQPFSWLIVFDEDLLLKIALLCEFLMQHNLIQGDKIVIPLSELKLLLQNNGWNENEAEKMIYLLCSVRIKMIDNGEETDSFLVHL